jgi:hypothetical protein
MFDGFDLMDFALAFVFIALGFALITATILLTLITLGVVHGV